MPYAAVVPLPTAAIRLPDLREEIAANIESRI
jgi:hypothetical protein